MFLFHRTVAQIRKEDAIPLVVNKDSVYKPIVRTAREFPKLHVSAKLQEALPFASKLKQDKPKNDKSYMARRAVILDPEERKQRSLIQQLYTIQEDKQNKRLVAQKQKSKEKEKAKERESKKFEDIHKEEKKRKYKDYGIQQAKRLKIME